MTFVVSGGTAQAIGGPFDKDGAIGKQFTKDGSVGENAYPALDWAVVHEMVFKVMHPLMEQLRYLCCRDRISTSQKIVSDQCDFMVNADARQIHGVCCMLLALASRANSASFMSCQGPQEAHLHLAHSRCFRQHTSVSA